MTIVQLQRVAAAIAATRKYLLVLMFAANACCWSRCSVKDVVHDAKSAEDTSYIMICKTQA